MVHEGDKHFEHCYAADFRSDVRPEEREACWQAWVIHYTRQQPSHRVDYAMLRIEALQNGDPPPVLPGLVQGPRTSDEVASELAEVDASASNTEPSLMSAFIDMDAGPVPNGCLTYCSTYESRCAARCPGRSVECRTGCERERAVCLRACH